AARARRGPHGVDILSSALDPRDCATSPASPNRRSEISRRNAVADLDEVTAARLDGGSGELLTICFEKSLITAPVLRSPDAEGALENRSCCGRIRISDDRWVKVRSLRAR